MRTAPCRSRYWGEERDPFSKSTHPCKNDQSHEFANRELLVDQQRQRQIMREMLGGRVWERGQQKKGGWGIRDVTIRTTGRKYSQVLKEKKTRKIERAQENGLVKTKDRVSLDRQSSHEKEMWTSMSAQIGKRGGRAEERNGPCFFPLSRFMSPVWEPAVRFGSSGARYMFGVLFVKREQVSVR